MVLDLGVRKRLRRTLGQRLVFVAAAAACLAFGAWMFGGAYVKDRHSAMNLAREWRIDGPACASLTRAAFEAQGLKLRQGTIYLDARFFRQVGHMSCSGLRHGGGWSSNLYPVCQFTSPRALKVSTGKGDWYYDIPAGQPATVAVRRGTPQCVMAANFTMKRLMRRETE